MSPNIPGNVARNSGECPQTFWGMLLNILGNVLKHSAEGTFQGISPDIPGNVAKHFRECPQTFRGMSVSLKGIIIIIIIIIIVVNLFYFSYIIVAKPKTVC